MENYLEILKDSLIKKIRILEEIVKIDDEQTTLFSTDKDNEDRIRETFDRKSALIDEINRMDAGFESVYPVSVYGDRTGYPGRVLLQLPSCRRIDQRDLCPVQAGCVCHRKYQCEIRF